MLPVLLVLSLSIRPVYAFSVLISPTSAYITLDGSVIFTSTVSRGFSPYTYRWYLNGSWSGWNDSIAIFNPFSDGCYVIYLEVTDNSNVTVRSNNATVVVYPPIPQANFTYSPTYPHANQSVTFDASASSSGANILIIKNYQWDFGDGTRASGKIVTYSYKFCGTYNVTLNVTNCLDYWDVESKLIVVMLSHGPEANFVETPETPLVMEVVKFDASSSLPGWNGTDWIPILEYRWDFGDGNNTVTSTPIVYHSFSSVGIYYVILTVYAPGATPETDSTTHRKTVTTMPVGGYSVPIKRYTTAKPLTLYLTIIAISTAFFMIFKRRTHGRKNNPRKTRSVRSSITLYGDRTIDRI